MTKPGTSRTTLTILAFAAIALLFTLAACGDKGEEAKDSASANLAIAESALTTMAPDAQLLVVQADAAAEAGTTAVWTYLFGSPDSGKLYSVSIINGTSMGATEIGASPLTEGEWDAVPENGSWKIDSDEALEKALEVAGLETAPGNYSMLLNTYVPETPTAERPAKAMVWYVSLGADDSGSAKVITVDAKTGDAAYAE